MIESFNVNDVNELRPRYPLNSMQLIKENDEVSHECPVNESQQAGKKFSHISLLSHQRIDEPKDEHEIENLIGIHNNVPTSSCLSVNKQSIEYDLFVPESCSANVQLLKSHTTEKHQLEEDDTPGPVLWRCPVSNIVFFVRGKLQTDQECCFALTYLESSSSGVGGNNNNVDVSAMSFSIYILKCENVQQVDDVFEAFSKPFRRRSVGDEDSSSTTTSPTLSSHGDSSVVQNFINKSDTPSKKNVTFEVGVEIREEKKDVFLGGDSVSAAGGETRRSNINLSFETVPFQKQCFKVRKNVTKKVVISVSQVPVKGGNTSSDILMIERCFGVLISPGRKIESEGMQFLENIQLLKLPTSNSKLKLKPNDETTTDHVSSNGIIALSNAKSNGQNESQTTASETVTNTSFDQSGSSRIMISGLWNPSEPSNYPSSSAVSSSNSSLNGSMRKNNPLNVETPSDVSFIPMSIAVDLVMGGVVEPVRFVIDTRARVYGSHERFWYFSKTTLRKRFHLYLRQRDVTPPPPVTSLTSHASDLDLLDLELDDRNKIEVEEILPSPSLPGTINSICYEVSGISPENVSTNAASNFRNERSSSGKSITANGGSLISTSSTVRKSFTSQLANLMSSSTISSIGESLRQSAVAYTTGSDSNNATPSSNHRDLPHHHQSSNVQQSSFKNIFSNNNSSNTILKSGQLNDLGLQSPTTPAHLEESGGESGDEELILSGFGNVSKDCSISELEAWSQILKDWDFSNTLHTSSSASEHNNNSQEIVSLLSGGWKRPVHPSQLPRLVVHGIPEALRGEIWQRMVVSGGQMNHLIESYRLLVTKESPDEKIIMRDIHRTFPAHDFFKENGGVGQEVLYRIAKCYSVFDSEIGYCQGQSFLIAALVLQMPEEQAFGVLVGMMHSLGLRDMFRENFELLQLRLHQLDCLIRDNMPQLFQHFQTIGLESHMYASQWFLTVFSAKFPLYLVFRVIDVFLMKGFDTIFQVALAILHVSFTDMMALDFEGIMKYFRVNVPKRYRNEEHAKNLILKAVTISIKPKRLKKYEKEWKIAREAEHAQEDPLVVLERDNKRLSEANMRLDMENDNLATQLVTSKIGMRHQLDHLEDQRDSANKRSHSDNATIKEISDELNILKTENERLKEMLKDEVEKNDALQKRLEQFVIDEFKDSLSENEDNFDDAVEDNKTLMVSAPIRIEEQTSKTPEVHKNDPDDDSKKNDEL